MNEGINELEVNKWGKKSCLTFKYQSKNVFYISNTKIFCWCLAVRKPKHQKKILLDCHKRKRNEKRVCLDQTDKIISLIYKNDNNIKKIKFSA